MELEQALKLLEPATGVASVDADDIGRWQARLDTALQQLGRLTLTDSVDTVLDLKEELKDFAVRASMVGQVKAGKTALTNALIGRPELLPSDVNPWTSVVTSVHVNRPQPKGKDAVFRFFSTEEWDKMVEIGGHLGEMAVRANHKDELVELRKQIIAMQTRTKNRLGRNFEFLLDGYHSFLGFTPDMVKKYVCLGDDDDNPDGRYADMTKSADLYIDNANFKVPSVISDTPGVNDPFLLREAVTLDNLADTDICVIVLSAHQAFSSVDVALMRVLTALKHNQLVIFVNRIDELQDPDQQVIEIDRYVRDLLDEQDMPKDIPIIFGSADWATAAETGVFENDYSRSQLENLVTERASRLKDSNVTDIGQAPLGSTANTTSKTRDLSGLHELRAILDDRSCRKIARPRLERMRDKALDVARQSLLYLETVNGQSMEVQPDLDFQALFDELDTMLLAADQTCGKIFNELTEKTLFMMSSAFREFTHHEKVNLSRHLSNRQPVKDWSPDTDQLRRSLNLAHDELVGYAPQLIGKFYARVAEQLEVIYTMVLDDEGELFAVRPPEAPTPKAPTSLMRTMAIDMNTGWLTDWFASRFNKDSYVAKFEELCQAEMQTTLKEMRAIYIAAFEQEVRHTLHGFLQEHVTTLRNLSQLGGESQRADAIRKLGVDSEIQQRLAELESVIVSLETLFTAPADTATKNGAQSVA